MLRQEKEWNQTELAKRLGVGRTTITEYEREAIVPPYDKILELSKMFGVSVKYLTGESNSRTEVIDDVHDLAEVLTHWIDVLNDKNSAVKLNGNMMNPETKKIAAEQIKQSLTVIEYLNK